MEIRKVLTRDSFIDLINSYGINETFLHVNQKNLWLVITEPFSPFFRDKKDYIFMQPEVSVFG